MASSYSCSWTVAFHFQVNRKSRLAELADLRALTHFSLSLSVEGYPSMITFRISFAPTRLVASFIISKKSWRGLTMVGDELCSKTQMRSPLTIGDAEIKE